MSELEKLIEGLAGNIGSPAFYIGLGTLGACLLVAWFVSLRLRARVASRENHRWAFGEGGFDRVAFPLVALTLVWLAKQALRHFDVVQATPILDLANMLLLAMAVVRFAVYVLRSVLPEGGFLRGSERTIAWVMWIGVVLYLTGLLPEIATALDDIAFTVGKQRISLLLVITGVLSITVTLAVSMWIASLVDRRVMRAENVEMSTRVVLSKLIRTVAFFAAILIALPIVGIDLTALSVFGGALGVGLGLGLQKIASNYVSGFIILLDRSLRIGDLVTVDGRTGVVKEIASRYTVIRTGDGTESIIPNDTLITQSVTNQTYSDRKAVVKMVFVVAYDSDIEQVFDIMLAAARAHSQTLAEPTPAALVTKVADPGVEVELSLWIDEVQKGSGVLKSDLYRTILKAFRERGITIPAPVREIRHPATAEIHEKPLKTGI